MSVFRSTLRNTAALGLIGAMICVGGTASAETTPGSNGYKPSVTATTQNDVRTVTPEQATAALNELRANFSNARSVDAAGTETFQLGKGLSMRFEKDTSNRIGGGMDGWKPYVDFNQEEQGYLITGATGMLTGAICAIPGVGWAACAVAGALISVAADYLKNRRCNGNLRVTVGSARCV